MFNSLSATDNHLKHQRIPGTVPHVAVAMLVAFLVRMLSWKQVFSATGLRFLDNDSYYHAFRVRSTLETFPRIPWFDGGINFPYGAQIIWPPLFDFIPASICKLLELGGVPPENTLVLLPFVPVVAGVMQVPLMVALWREFFPDQPVYAVAWLTALLPASAHFGMLGRFDQHVTELLLFTAILLLFSRAIRQKRRGILTPDEGICGAVIALAFWNWQGSVLNLAVLVALALVIHVTAPPDSYLATSALKALGRSSAAGALLLLATIPLFAPAGALFEIQLTSVSGFPAVAAGSVSLFAFSLLLWHKYQPAASTLARSGRAILCGGSVLVMALLLSHDLQKVLRHGYAMLSAGNAWYRNIQEFDPLFFAGFTPVGDEIIDALKLLGFSGIFLLAALPHLVSRRNTTPAAWPGATLTISLAALFLPLGLLRIRFLLYLLVPLTLSAALAWCAGASCLAKRLDRGIFPRSLAPAGLGLLLLIPCLFWYTETWSIRPDSSRESLLTALSWLRQQNPAVAGNDGVMAEWDYGHIIRYAAYRPVVVTPFGTDLGPDGMRDSTAFFLSRDAASAEATLVRRRIGFILLANPMTEACFSWNFAPAGTPRAIEMSRDWRTGVRTRILAPFWDIVPSKLYFNDGMAIGNNLGDTAAFCRLVYETAPVTATVDFPPTADFKLFEMVPGVKLQGRGRPGTLVTASCTVTTNAARTFTWQNTVTVPASGTFTLRLPYTSGTNRLVTAGPYRINNGGAITTLAVTEQEIRSGSLVSLNKAQSIVGKVKVP